MSLFTLSDDLIWTIKDKVWKLRHKQVIQDFKKETMKKIKKQMTPRPTQMKKHEKNMKKNK